MGLNFGLNLHQYFVNGSSKGTGEFAHLFNNAISMKVSCPGSYVVIFLICDLKLIDNSRTFLFSNIYLDNLIGFIFTPING